MTGPVSPPMSLSGWLRWYALQPELRRIARGARILEIGCGLGGFAARVDPWLNYTGYEMDATSAVVAATRVRRGSVHNGALPDRPTAMFDVVVAFEVLEHMNDDRGALASWAAWARPGGIVLLSVPADPERFGPSDHHVGHHRRYTDAGLAEVMAAAGLTGVAVRRYGAPLTYVTDGIRNRLVPGGIRDSDDGTAASGRWLQPGGLAGWATWLAVQPFRQAQRLLGQHGFGLGLIGRGAKEVT